MPAKGGNVGQFGIAPVSSVARIYRCTWRDNLWRIKWDCDGRTIRSEIAFPGDHGFATFCDAVRAAVALGFREGNIVPEMRLS